MTLSQQQNFAIAAKRDRKEKELAAVGELLHAVDGATAGQCSICLDEMQQDSKVVQLSCGHVFHKACVKKWLLTKRMKKLIPSIAAKLWRALWQTLHSQVTQKAQRYISICRMLETEELGFDVQELLSGVC